MDKETDFAQRCLCLDLEVDPVDKHILKIGALPIAPTTIVIGKIYANQIAATIRSRALSLR